MYVLFPIPKLGGREQLTRKNKFRNIILKIVLITSKAQIRVVNVPYEGALYVHKILVPLKLFFLL